MRTRRRSSYIHTRACSHTLAPPTRLSWARALLGRRWRCKSKLPERGGNHEAVWKQTCACLRWCDISGLTWSGTLPPRAWRELPGKDTDGGLGSPGGAFHGVNKKPRTATETTRVTQTGGFLPSRFMLLRIMWLTCMQFCCFLHKDL